MTSFSDKIKQIYAGFEIPSSFDIYFTQKDLDYSVNFLIYMILYKFKNTPNITKNKLLFVDYMNKFLDVVNDIPQIDDSTEVIKVICPRTNNITFSMAKKSLGIPSNETIPEQLKNNKEINETVFKNICNLFYTKTFKSDFNSIKYDVANALLNPIFVLTNTYVKGMYLNNAPNNHNNNIIDYGLNLVVKEYIKQNKMMVAMKEPLFCYFKSILCAIELPEIINDKNIIVRTNKYDLLLSKIDKTFISIEYNFINSNNKRWKMPLIIHTEDGYYRKFLPSFLLMFSKYWNMV